ncbi:MAG: hypothetical protein JSW09_04345 [Pseudomonadota bacterium]|nr:MAG: hypothetical protein JSW09_04345 [Pseudomonadota bacterium]
MPLRLSRNYHSNSGRDAAAHPFPARGALLKGAGDDIVLGLSWPIAVFAAFALILALTLYRRTLD